ncbi:MAG: hypothetical protein U1E56_06605 [Bauldia sp.]
MADFYNVLLNSLKQRDIWDPAARDSVYVQARLAMIKRLWGFQPALSTAQIEDRVRAFDTAVQRIEQEVAMAIARHREAEYAREHGYDQDRRYAAHAAQPAERWEEVEVEEEEPPRPGTIGKRLDAREVRSLLSRSVARLNPVRGGSRDYSDRDLVPPSPTRRYLALGVFATAALVFGFIAYVFFPILTPRVSDAATEPQPPATAVAAAATATTRAIAPPPQAAPAANGPKAAGTNERVPVQSAARAASTIALFDGTNPTVFVSSADNPIRSASDAQGGFVRISSSQGANSVRAAILPGLVTRLAGKTVRVIVQVRSATEGGASSIRFAYQATGTVSQWKTAQLNTGYATVELTWPVPLSGTGTTHAILIEPGTPGDRTAADIRSISLEVVGP